MIAQSDSQKFAAIKGGVSGIGVSKKISGYTYIDDLDTSQLCEVTAVHTQVDPSDPCAIVKFQGGATALSFGHLLLASLVFDT